MLLTSREYENIHQLFNRAEVFSLLGGASGVENPAGEADTRRPRRFFGGGNEEISGRGR